MYHVVHRHIIIRQSSVESEEFAALLVILRRRLPTIDMEVAVPSCGEAIDTTGLQPERVVY